MGEGLIQCPRDNAQVFCERRHLAMPVFARLLTENGGGMNRRERLPRQASRPQDTAVARRQRLKVTVSDDPSKAPPKAGGLGGLFAKKARYAARPDVIQKSVANLQAVLPPV